MSLKSFTDAYITAALWSSNDNADDSGGEPLDRNYGPEDMADVTMAQMQREAQAFYDAHSDKFTDENCSYTGCPVDEYAGHDFWLTRNHHGAGFWDGDWKEPVASQLTEAAHAAGERDLYVGDDGLIYLM